ncbi:MAG: MlaD family protein [Candidatus Gastranaerophilales bacterium]|nr:MlaD family protein [Candidatus Gastranaerophilales bacterium]
MRKSSAVKVGILTLVAIAILISSLLWLKGRSMSAGKRIEVLFNDIDGMRPGSAVQMMGIRIGQIEETAPVITTDESYVKVKFVITEPNISIPNASEISIQQSGIIGEKFLEITPPKKRYLYLPIFPNSKKVLFENSDVDMFVEGDYIKIGSIKSTEIVNTSALSILQKSSISTKFAYKIGYIVTKPGVVVPDVFEASIIKENKKDAKLRITPPKEVTVCLPKYQSDYTIVEPFRLKDFFDIQVKTAVSLNETNERINEILSNDTIEDLKITLNNVKLLTAKANTTLDNASALLEVSKNEIEDVTAMATQLTGKITILTDNINNIVADPEFKDNFISATKSVGEISSTLNNVLENGNAEDTFKYINETVKNLSEISVFLNETAQDPAIKSKIDCTVVNLNKSLDKFSQLADNFNNLSEEEKIKLKAILKDTATTSENMKLFSEKLNKRFLLFRLMF